MKKYNQALEDLKNIKNKWEYDEARDSETINVKVSQRTVDSINIAIDALASAKKMSAFLYQLDQARKMVITGRDCISYAKAEVLGNVIEQLKDIYHQD